jgi:predicted ATPase
MGGLETHMVGREAELIQLKACYRQARAASVPVFVLVQSEAGLGKSRLMMEFSSQLEADEPGLAMFSTRGLAQTSRAPFYLWKSLWYNRFGLYDNEKPTALREKFLRGIQSLWGTGRSPISAVEAAHWIGSLSGLEWPDSPYLVKIQAEAGAGLRRSFEMTREILRRVCLSGPTILVFDDMQWADESSLSLLAHLLKPAAEPLPLLILAAARPELLQRYPALARVTKVITLQPLPSSSEIVAEAYPALHSLPTGLLSDLAQRAEGNPYYLEEMVKSLMLAKPTLLEPSEVWQTQQLRGILPESLQAVLQARLDALSLEARSTALLASVVGRVFWVGAVEAASRQTAGTGLLRQPGDESEETVAHGLAELTRAEMAFPRAGSVFAGEQEYIFKHSILREVAYNLIPHKYVRQYHLAIARWLSNRAGPDFSARVAEHLEQAGVYGEAANQYEQAARFVQSRGAAKEADWMLKRAKMLRDKLPVTAPLGRGT